MSDVSVGPIGADTHLKRSALPAWPASRRSWGSAIENASPTTLAAIFCLVLTAFVLIALSPPFSPDVAGQLWIAHHMRLGARLYVDISEVNPPLWFWAVMPIDWLAERLHAHVETVLVVAIGAASFLSLAATGRLMKDVAPSNRVMLLAYTALILLILPIRDFGQREQYTLVLCIPYITLVDVRRRGGKVAVPLALAIGVAAGLGFMLKHYFLAVPVLLELGLILSLRRAWRPLRAETLALAATAIAYLASMVAITPAYFTVMVPQLRLAYGATDALSIFAMIGPIQFLWVILLVVAVLHWRDLRAGAIPFAPAYLLGALAFWAAWYVQHKGWPYQSIPTTGMLVLGCAALMLAGDRRPPRLPPLLCSVILMLPVMLPFSHSLHYPAQGWYLDETLTGLRPGDVVGLIARDGMASLSPMTMQRGFRYSGRYTRYWALDAVDTNTRSRHDPRVDALAREFVHNTVDDYHCLQPSRIVFQSPATIPADALATTNTIAYFERDPGFADVMRHYRYLRRGGDFVAFQRIAPLRPLPGVPCQRGM